MANKTAISQHKNFKDTVIGNRLHQHICQALWDKSNHLSGIEIDYNASRQGMLRLFTDEIMPMNVCV